MEGRACKSMSHKQQATSQTKNKITNKYRGIDIREHRKQREAKAEGEQVQENKAEGEEREV